ncbi:MAG: hypothetical protein Q9217_002875 [Psora testacea]
MTLNLAPCVASDAPELARIHYAVFSRPPIYQAIYRDASPADVIAKHEKSFAAGLQEQDHPSSSSSREVHYLKITDDAINAMIIAYIVWIYLPHGYDVDKDPQAHAERLVEGTNEAMAMEFKGAIGVLRGEHEGRRGPHLYSSVTGHALYRRYGFEDVGDMRVDLDKYKGGQGLGMQRWVAMVREPGKT